MAVPRKTRKTTKGKGTKLAGKRRITGKGFLTDMAIKVAPDIGSMLISELAKMLINKGIARYTVPR